MKHVDVPTVVRAHLHAFPHGFYSRLGDGFMTAYLREHLRSPAACSLSAVDSQTGELVGYLFGTVDDAAHRAYKAANSTSSLLRAGASALRRRPALWGEFLRVRALWYLRRLARARVAARRPSGSRGPADASAELQYICVIPAVRLRGVGAALHDCFVEHARGAGAATLHLVTEEGNEISRAFYEHRGWVAESTVTSRDGRRLLRMVRRLPAEVA